MKTKSIIWIMTLILLIGIVNAIGYDDAVHYWSFDVDETSDKGGRNFTNQGADLETVDCASSSCYNFTLANTDFMNISNIGVDFTENWTIAMFVRPQQADARVVWTNPHGAASLAESVHIGSYDAAAGFVLLESYADNQVNAGAVSVDIWKSYIYTYIKDTKRFTVYINGVSAGTGTQASALTGALSNPDFSLGYRTWNTDQWFQGSLDEIIIFDYLITTADILVLNDTSNYPLTSTVITPTNFTITTIAEYWNNSLQNFTGIINNTLTLTADGLNITTGILNNDTKPYNITISLNGYFNKTITNWNVTNNLQVNLTINHTVLNITAFDNAENQIENFTVIASSYNSTHIATDTTTSSELSLDLRWNETYNVSIDAEGFAFFNYLANITMDTFFKRQNYTELYATNTFFFTFRDEIDDNLVYNVSLELISDTFANNYTTNPNATISISLLVPENYIVRYSASSYPQRFSFFTLLNRSFNNITLYLATGSSNITATVFDEKGQTVEGARIEVLKYDINTNSYVLREQAETNFEGETILHLFKNVEFYKFRIRVNDVLRPIYPGLTTITEPTYIFGDTITFQINTKDQVAVDYYTTQGIDHTLVFNDATNNFRLDYSDSTGSTVTQVCLTVERLSGISTTAYNQSCLTTTSGTILVGVAAINGTTYIATSTATFTGTSHFLNKLIKVFVEVNNTGDLGLYLIILLTIVFAFAFLWSPVIALIATPIPLMMGSLIGFIAIDAGIMIFIEVIFIILAFIVSKRST